jgi:TldD protein
VGVRAVSGEKTAFAYSDDISVASLMDAAMTVRTIARPRKTSASRCLREKYRPAARSTPRLDPMSTLDSTAKVNLLGRVEKIARAKDPRVVQVMAGLATEYDVVMVARADGTLAADVRPLIRLSVTVIAEQNGRREVGSSWRRWPLWLWLTLTTPWSRAMCKKPSRPHSSTWRPVLLLLAR